jgi:hypothetical protein
MTWTPNGYGGHSLATQDGWAFVQDEWTRADAQVRINGRQERYEAPTVAEAKVWCEARVCAMEVSA